MFRGVALCLIAALLLSACGGSGKSNTATISSTAAVVVSTDTPNATPQPTSTPQPTATPSPTATPLPTATPQATPRATPVVTSATPVPTDKVVAELAEGVTAAYQAVNPTSSFSAGAPKIYLAFSTKDLPAGSLLETAWIAVKVDADVPADYQIDRAHLTVQGSQSGDFSLSRPADGFPTGSYRVDLYLNGTLIGSYKFEVK